jgi:uncharacterized phiE125 gp8 family phage protein
MAALPIPLDVLRTRLRIEVESDDADLATLSIAAREIIERETGLHLSSGTHTANIIPWRRFVPRVQPVDSITSITYTDAGGVTQTLPTTDYYIDNTDEMLAVGFDTIVLPKANTFPTVTYVAGYQRIPHALQQCIVALVGSWYSNPEATSVASLQDVPLSYRYILQQFSTRGPLR